MKKKRRLKLNELKALTKDRLENLKQILWSCFFTMTVLSCVQWKPHVYYSLWGIMGCYCSWEIALGKPIKHVPQRWESAGKLRTAVCDKLIHNLVSLTVRISSPPDTVHRPQTSNRLQHNEIHIYISRTKPLCSAGVCVKHKSGNHNLQMCKQM